MKKFPKAAKDPNSRLRQARRVMEVLKCTLCLHPCHCKVNRTIY